MLKTRLISAAIMIPLVVGGILFLPTDAVALILALIMGIGLWEWARMVPLQSVPAQLLYPAIIVLLCWLAWMTPLEALIDSLLVAALLWWLGALYWVSRAKISTQSSARVRLMKSVVGLLVMLPAWAALVMLHGREQDGPLFTLFLLVLIWLADSGAYFAGRRWGRTKLAPVVSPGKTWQGVYGAVVTSGLFALLVGLLYSQSLRWTAGLVLVSLLTVLFSIVGDLLESLMKRQHGIKDSSHIIPGHGGVLDRIDSLTAAAPVFLLGLYWLEL
ncbi:MAG: phosphatidate cytidylyltransferase [Gammaproteobacteria bacterium]|nr:phosphatidate cytidylyltransferase [Gammaproteobacteria bacterium]